MRSLADMLDAKTRRRPAASRPRPFQAGQRPSRPSRRRPAAHGASPRRSRRARPTGACCARTGGDEFAVLLPRPTAAAPPRRSRGTILALRSPRRCSSRARRLQVSASIGLAAPRSPRQRGRRASPERRRALCRQARRPQRLRLVRRGAGARADRAAEARGGHPPRDQTGRVRALLPAADRSCDAARSSASRRSPAGARRRRGLLEAEAFIEAAERTGLIGSADPERHGAGAARGARLAGAPQARGQRLARSSSAIRRSPSRS